MDAQVPLTSEYLRLLTWQPPEFEYGESTKGPQAACAAAADLVNVPNL